MSAEKVKRGVGGVMVNSHGFAMKFVAEPCLVIFGVIVMICGLLKFGRRMHFFQDVL